MAKRKYRPALTPGVVRTLPKNALFPARKHIETENAFLADCLEKWISSPSGYLKELQAWAEAAWKSDDPTAVGYSQAVLDGVAGLVGCLNGTPRKAATAGIVLGLAAERLRCYLESPAVIRGEQVLKAASNGHAQVHGTPGAKQARWAEMQKRLNEILTDDNIGIVTARKRVAKEFHVSPKTVQRNTKANR